MGSLCLSAAPILRCEALTRIQSIIIIVPTALEVIISTSLIFHKSGAGRRHLLLTVEGWTYFSLALLELLSHIIPAVRDSLSTFRNIDIIIAATSSIPLLFYTLFIFFLSRMELVGMLPRRFQNFSIFLLAMFIPAIVALNELGSFLGITHALISVGGRSVLAIGFRTNEDKIIWTIVTSVTLALLTAYQALNFCLVFFRFITVCINKRRAEDLDANEIHLYKGIAWLSAAFKLGAIETVIGLAQNGFAITLTRRILRMLTRALFCIGVFKGVDYYEDITQFRTELVQTSRKKDFNPSRLRELISNPRNSTFLRLSPKATDFHSATRAVGDTPRTQGGLTGMGEFAKYKASQHVTVRYSTGAPTLHMRFSALDIPSPDTIVESIKSQPPSEWRSSTYSPYYPPSIMTANRTDPVPPIPTSTPASLLLSTPSYSYQRSVPPAEADFDPPPINNIFAKMHTRGESEYSTKSYAESFNVIGELVPHFPLPGIREGRTLAQRQDMSLDPPIEDPRESDSMTSKRPNQTDALQRSSNPHDENVGDAEGRESLPQSVGGHASQGYVRAVDEAKYAIGSIALTGLTTTPAAGASTSIHANSYATSSITTPGNDADPFIYDEFQPAALDTGKSMDLPAQKSSEGQWTFRNLSYMHPRRDGTADDEPVILPWNGGRNEDVVMSTIQERVPVNRIKSIGKAPKRMTPMPMSMGLTRKSIYIEPILIPPKPPGMPEAIQGSYSSSFGAVDSEA